MSFNLIDLKSWKRRAYYNHYMDKVRCTYSLTVNIEVDALLKKIKPIGIKAYPVQIYLIAKAVNSFAEFRMSVNSEGQLGHWDVSHPSYALFNKASETFSSIYTPFNHDFHKFYQACDKDIENYRDAEVLFPQSGMPENLFTISSLPWINFTAFNLNVYGEGAYLPPIFTIGRYLEQNGKKHLPLSIQVHHAVCDGYHVGKFVEALQDMILNYNDWL